ncbi:MAG: hypothetical protein M3Q07_02160 [Pseudobdellovibrionaceae bacterium]|nr:hypothetical protein [Pseudobdellovibrionaceae bacterium]
MGHLRLEPTPKNDSIIIHFEDDGRGLAIGKLRNKANEMGLSRIENDLEQLAELVLSS